MEHEGDSDINCDWCAQNSPQGFAKRTWKLKDKRRSSIIKISQNTWKSPGDLRRIAVRQTPVSPVG